MEQFIYEGQVIWSQVDANQHLRHSAYADFAAQARVDLLHLIGLSAKYLHRHKIGPVLLKEELTYFKEVNLSEKIKVTCDLVSCKQDASRWKIKHQIFREDGVKAAEVFVEGAWIDMENRKLTALNGEMLSKFLAVPKVKDFVFI